MATGHGLDLQDSIPWRSKIYYYPYQFKKKQIKNLNWKLSRTFLLALLSDQLMWWQCQRWLTASLLTVIFSWWSPEALLITRVWLSQLTIKHRICAESLEGQERCLSRCQSLSVEWIGIGGRFIRSVYYSGNRLVPLRRKDLPLIRLLKARQYKCIYAWSPSLYGHVWVIWSSGTRSSGKN
jgi:hypothetical protein